MRPDSIVWFERLSLGSLALGLANSFLNWDEVVGTGPLSLLLVIMVLSLSLALLLVLGVSRWRSRLAKWILVTLTVSGFAMNFANFGGAGFEIWKPLDFVVAGLQLIAVGLLFTGPARTWLAGKDAGIDTRLQQTFE